MSADLIRASLFRAVLVVGLVATCLVWGPGHAGATSCRAWDGDVSTAWEVDANWVGDVGPGPADCASIDGNHDVVISTDVTIESIVFLEPGTLTVTDPGSLTLADADDVPIFGQDHSRIYAELANDGAVVVHAGSLEILEGGSGDGSFRGIGAGRVRFGGGTGAGSTYTLEQGGKLLGGVTIGIPGKITTPSDCGMRDATHRWMLGCQEAGRVDVADGAVATASRVNWQQGGVLGGQGTLEVHGTWHWTSLPNPVGQAPQVGAEVGSSLGHGVTRVVQGATLLVDGPFGPAAQPGPFGCGWNEDPAVHAFFPCGGVHLAEGRTIENHGTVKLVKAGFIGASAGTRFDNFGLFDIANQDSGNPTPNNDRGFFQGLDTGIGEFTNESVAIIHKGPGHGTAVIDADFTNHNPSSAAIRVDAGRLSLPDETVVTARVGSAQAIDNGDTRTRTSPEGADVTDTTFATSVENRSDFGANLRVAPGAVGAPGGLTPVSSASRVSNLSGLAVETTTTLHFDAALLGGRDPSEVLVVSGDVVLPECSSPAPPAGALCILSRNAVPDGGETDVSVEVHASIAANASRSFRGEVCSDGSKVTVSVGSSIGTHSVGANKCIAWHISGSHHVIDQVPLGDSNSRLIDSFKSSVPMRAAGKFPLVYEKDSPAAGSVIVRPVVDLSRRTVTWRWGPVTSCGSPRFNVTWKGGGRHGALATNSTASSANLPSGHFRVTISVQFVNGSTKKRSGWATVTANLP